jgi:hypothetical protein
MQTKTNTNDFWLAINNNHDDEAMAVLRQEALPLPGGAPSPRIAELTAQYNWDSTQLLSLVCVTEGACGGPVANDVHRFCGKYACVASSHQNGATTMTPGWYISAGSSSNGIFRTPFLPLQSAGGPINNRGATMLTDGDPPFRLNRVQWVLVMEGWDPAGSESEKVSDSPGAESSWDYTLAKMGDDSSLPALVEDVPQRSVPPLSIQVPPPTLTHTVDELREMYFQLENWVRAAKTRMDALESSNTIFEHNVDHLRTELIRVTRHVMANPIRTPDDPGNNVLAERLESLRFELTNEQGHFARLKSKVILLREHQESGGGVELSGIRFPACNSMLAWYEERNPPMGIFMDAHAMLHAIAPAVSSATDTMRFLESQQRVDQKTGLESAVVTSFHTIIPSVFIGSSKNVEGGIFAALKGSMKDYNAWKPAQSQSTGMAKRIKDGVAQVDNRITTMRAEILENELIRVSNTLVTDSMVFCTHLCSFLEEQHVTYSEGTGYSAATVWDMQLECLQTILEELHNARIGVVDAARHRPGLLLWGMIQAWKVQKRYMNNNFGDDPALTGILVRRLIMQGDDKGSQNNRLKSSRRQSTSISETMHPSSKRSMTRLPKQSDGNAHNQYISSEVRLKKKRKL